MRPGGLAQVGPDDNDTLGQAWPSLLAKSEANKASKAEPQGFHAINVRQGGPPSIFASTTACTASVEKVPTA